MPEYQRKLPHFHPDDSWLFLTWRLCGSMPAITDSIIYPTPDHAFVSQDRILDRRSTGPRWLLDPRIADLVANAILIGESERHFYQLGAWVVRPNHAHMLILPMVPVQVLMRWLKGSTARKANQILRRTWEPFWQAESWDHYLRSAAQLTAPKHTLSTTRCRLGWLVPRNAGGGQVQDGRRNRLPYQSRVD
jgi:putative transposase